MYVRNQYRILEGPAPQRFRPFVVRTAAGTDERYLEHGSALSYKRGGTRV